MVRNAGGRRDTLHLWTFKMHVYNNSKHLQEHIQTKYFIVRERDGNPRNSDEREPAVKNI